MARKQSSSNPNRLEFRTVTLNSILARQLRNPNEFILRSVADGKLYKLSLLGPIRVNDKPCPVSDAEPLPHASKRHKSLTVFLEPNHVEFRGEIGSLLDVHFAEYELQGLQTKLRSSET